MENHRGIINFISGINNKVLEVKLVRLLNGLPRILANYGVAVLVVDVISLKPESCIFIQNSKRDFQKIKRFFVVGHSMTSSPNSDNIDKYLFLINGEN